MAYGTSQVDSSGLFYSVRVSNADQSFIAEVQGYAVEDMDTGVADQVSADATFQQLLDVLSSVPEFTVTQSYKRTTASQPVTVTPAP
jgi:hypothetical protein